MDEEKIILKPGKLSLNDRRFIEENCGKKTIQEIARVLKRHEEPIKKYIRENNLVYTRPGEDSLYADLREKLKDRYYYKELILQFTHEEIEMFENMWIDLMRQFKENILPTEEIQMKQWITIEILSNRSMRNRKSAIDDIDRLQKIINAEYAKDEIDRNWGTIQNLETQIGLAKAAQQGYTTEHSKLTADAKSLARDLKATRQERITKVEENRSTFMGLVKMLEEDDIKEREGEFGGLMQKAIDKTRRKFSELHKFLDGAYDLPILNSSTIENYEQELIKEETADGEEE